MSGRAPVWLDDLRGTADWRAAHTALAADGTVARPHFPWTDDDQPGFGRFLTWLGDRFEDRVALADYSGVRLGPRGEGATPRMVTYRELSGRVRRAAGWLRERGIGTWDHVGLCLPNGIDVLVLQYAAACLGAVASPINLDQRDRVGAILRGADHRLVFVAGEAAAFAAEHGLERGRVVDVRGREFAEEIERATAIGADANSGAVDDPVVTLYTSGTTGAPKGAMLSPRGLFTGALALQEGFELRGDDRFLLVNPLYHINSIAFSLALFGVGARVAIPPFGRHWDVAAAEGITATSLVQRHLTPLLESASAADRRNAAAFERLLERGTLRWVAVGSGPLAPDVQRAFLDRGVLILFRWGMSENCLAGTNMRPGQELAYYAERIGSTGPTNRYLNLFVVDVRGELRESGRGRLVQRGCLFVAYTDPAASRAAFVGGVHDTGDVAEITPDERHVYIVGRTKETILRSGENIFPQDVDNHLMAHPAVTFAQTVGYPDPEHSEEVGAFVVVTAEAPPERTLLEHAARIGIQKRPKCLICLTAEQESGFLRYSGPGKPQRLANQVLFWRMHFLEETSRLMARAGVLPSGTVGYGVAGRDGIAWLLVGPRVGEIDWLACGAALEEYLRQAARVSADELALLLERRGLTLGDFQPSEARVLERSAVAMAGDAGRNRALVVAELWPRARVISGGSAISASDWVRSGGSCDNPTPRPSPTKGGELGSARRGKTPKQEQV